MLKITTFVLIKLLQIVMAIQVQRDPALEQIIMFKERNPNPIGTLTTSAGAPVPLIDASRTLNTRFISNEYFMDSMSHLIRERIPERVIYSKATGAFGYFEVTHDITNICKAKLFNKVGKKTNIVVRFSTGFEMKGGNDLARDIRGFAVKFYTEDGIFDLVCLSVPIYAFKDPLLFASFIHSQKKNSASNLNDPSMFWDFLSLRPEALHMFLYLLGDLGIPVNYRHIPGFGIHSIQVINDDGNIFFVRFHIIPDAGIKTLDSDEATNIQSVDPDYFHRDLYRAIGNGDFPVWTLNIQVLTLNEAENLGSYAFDVTRILPLDRFPLQPVGKLVLNRNVLNHFAQMEQLAYNPGNLVPGILGGLDHIFQARRLAYREAQTYRLGTNFYNIPVNCPFKSKVLTYNRDGRPPVGSNEYDIPNYYPNSFNGPVPCINNNSTPLIELVEGPPNNFQQAGDYVNQLSAGEFNRLVRNIVNSLRLAVKFIQERVKKLYILLHPELGRRIAEGLLTNVTADNV